jgi:hypothetical protein
MGKRNAGTTAWAALMGDVAVLRMRLETLKRNVDRVGEDIDAMLKAPPFVAEKKAERTDG